MAERPAAALAVVEVGALEVDPDADDEGAEVVVDDLLSFPLDDGAAVVELAEEDEEEEGGLNNY